MSKRKETKNEGKVGVALRPSGDELSEDLIAGFCIRSIVLITDLYNHFVDNLCPRPVLPHLPGIISVHNHLSLSRRSSFRGCQKGRYDPFY